MKRLERLNDPLRCALYDTRARKELVHTNEFRNASYKHNVASNIDFIVLSPFLPTPELLSTSE